MSRDQSPVAIQRGEGPTEAEEKRLRSAIDRAKAKGRTRQKPGAMSGTPRFDDVAAGQVPAPHSAPPAELSEETQEGLDALNEAMVRQQVSSQAAEEADDEEAALPAQEVSLTREERIKRAVEARLIPIDIGEFLVNGTVSQRVPIIDTDSAKLIVTYQTVREVVEVFIDGCLAEEAAEIRTVRDDAGKKLYDVEMSQREYIRRQNEWALAAQIKSYQGTDWPSPVRSNGDTHAEAMTQRLRKVRELPSPVFALLTQNLGWFIERVGNSLTSAALGNG